MDSSLEGVPDNCTQVGGIAIAILMGPDGSLDYAYGINDLSTPSAIGYLTTVIDRLRDQERVQWSLDMDEEAPPCIGPECPECGYTAEPDEDGEDDEGAPA